MVWKKGKEIIGDIVQRYFEDLFSASDNPSNMDDALVGLSTCFTMDMNMALTKVPMGEEVREALFATHPNKPQASMISMLYFFKSFGM